MTTPDDEHPFGVERVDLGGFQFTPELLNRVPVTVARRFRVIPIYQGCGCVCVATADPFNLKAIDELRLTLKCELEIRQADPKQLQLFISKFYGEDEASPIQEG